MVSVLNLGKHSKSRRIDTEIKIRQILEKWQSAWERKDITTYMSIYADTARITRVTVQKGRETSINLTKAQLRQEMQKLSTMYSGIQVSPYNLQINENSTFADVSVLHKFIASHALGVQLPYSDYGIKKLNLMVDPVDGNWKIYSETWNLYKNVPELPILEENK